MLNSFGDQFGEVTPGYNVGMQFELPYGNRAAKSRLQQNQLQVNRIKFELKDVMQTVAAESQTALRRVASASQTMRAASESVMAARADLEQIERRWEAYGLVEGDALSGQTPTTLLDQLLDSQDRLAAAEALFVQSEVELKISEVALQRAMGTLLIANGIAAPGQ